MITEKLRVQRREGERRRRLAFVAEGRCPECGGRRPLAPGRKKCQECLDWYRLWRQEYNARRIENGICTRCGKPNDRPGIHCCTACMERETERAKEWSRKKNGSTIDCKA